MSSLKKAGSGGQDAGKASASVPGERRVLSSKLTQMKFMSKPSSTPTKPTNSTSSTLSTSTPSNKIQSSQWTSAHSHSDSFNRLASSSSSNSLPSSIDNSFQFVLPSSSSSLSSTSLSSSSSSPLVILSSTLDSSSLPVPPVPPPRFIAGRRSFGRFNPILDSVIAEAKRIDSGEQEQPKQQKQTNQEEEGEEEEEELSQRYETSSRNGQQRESGNVQIGQSSSAGKGRKKGISGQGNNQLDPDSKRKSHSDQKPDYKRRRQQ